MKLERGEMKLMKERIRPDRGEDFDVDPVTVDKNFIKSANTIEDLNNAIATIYFILEYHGLLKMEKPRK